MTDIEEINGQWEREAIRPKILLHSCCAPCSTYTLEFLTPICRHCNLFREFKYSSEK